MALKALDKLSRKLLRDAKKARKLCGSVGKTDSDYYYGIAEGLDRAATQVRCEFIRVNILQREATTANPTPSA